MKTGAGGLRIERGARPTEAELELIDQGLIEHAMEAGVEARNFENLAVLLRDDEGRVMGGLIGATVWGWLMVKRLWVAEQYRGMGYGAELMEEAEDEAKRRDCRHSLLDTYDFQAREFYERCGYSVFAALTDFPLGHSRFFMRKNLA